MDWLCVHVRKMTVNTSLVWKCMRQVLVGEELKQKTWYLKDVGYFCVCKEPFTLFKANIFIFWKLKNVSRRAKCSKSALNDLTSQLLTRFYVLLILIPVSSDLFGLCCSANQNAPRGSRDAAAWKRDGWQQENTLVAPVGLTPVTGADLAWGPREDTRGVLSAWV